MHRNGRIGIALSLLWLAAFTPAKERRLAEEFAPVLRQETGHGWRYDIPVAADFDGDWLARNNWRNAETAELVPTLYYRARSVPGATLLFFVGFYPRDYSWICLPVICHENDLEGMVLRIENGKIRSVETQFHNAFRAALPEFSSGRPLVRAEWGGHGWLPGMGTGIELSPGPAAPVGRDAPVRAYYRLLPLTILEEQARAGGDGFGIQSLDGLFQAMDGDDYNWTYARFPWSWNYGGWTGGQWYWRGP